MVTQTLTVEIEGPRLLSTRSATSEVLEDNREGEPPDGLTLSKGELTLDQEADAQRAGAAEHSATTALSDDGVGPTNVESEPEVGNSSVVLKEIPIDEEEPQPPCRVEGAVEEPHATDLDA